MKAKIKATGEIINIEEDGYWQNVRIQAAIVAMQGVMNFFGSIDYNRETIVRLAVEQADALIDILKKYYLLIKRIHQYILYIYLLHLHY